MIKRLLTFAICFLFLMPSSDDAQPQVVKFDWENLDKQPINIWQDSSGIHLKLNKWGEECFFSIDADWAIPALGQLQGIRDDLLRMEFATGQIEIERKSPEEFKPGFVRSERGGVEIFIKFNVKPLNNVFKFPIKSKNLEFFYQPPLTEQDWSRYPDVTVTETTVIDNTITDPDLSNIIIYRPEEVVGSYAVYHKSRNRYNRGEQEAEKYKVGKAFHLFRPKIIDNDGNWVWISMDIDTVNNLLTLTVDQAFLDTARYPITIDPTFGYENIGGTDINIRDWIAGDRELNNTGNGDADYMMAYVAIKGGTRKAKCALYSNASPTVYIQTTDERLDIPTETWDWYQFNFSTQPAVVFGTKYYLDVWGDASGGAGPYATAKFDARVEDFINKTNQAYDGWPANLARAASQEHYSVYVSFTSTDPAFVPKAIVVGSKGRTNKILKKGGVNARTQ